MEKIQFDSGVRTYRVNGKGVLTFNPADPNLYARFASAGEKLPEMEKTLFQQAEGDMLSGLQAADRELKGLLSWVFPGNDFGEIFDGVNLLAVTQSGKTVMENFLDALTPILCQGAESCAEGYAKTAMDKAAARREMQC